MSDYTFMFYFSIVMPLFGALFMLMLEGNRSSWQENLRLLLFGIVGSIILSFLNPLIYNHFLPLLSEKDKDGPVMISGILTMLVVIILAHKRRR